MELDFRSKIDTPTYYASSRILAKKEDINRRLRGNQLSLLCCMSGKSKNNQFSCMLFDGREFQKGKLLVVAEGIEFESNNGIFSRKMNLMIPKSDILNIEKKNEVSPLYSNAIAILTDMGEIIVANFENPEVVAGLMHSRFERREVGTN